jgi:hypothetical protein
MSAATAARARLSRLLLEASVDLGALRALSSELGAHVAALEAPSPARPILALISVDLHNYYTALESLFERTARHLDEAVPSGADWHVELVDQMAADLPPVEAARMHTAGLPSGELRPTGGADLDHPARQPLRHGASQLGRFDHGRGPPRGHVRHPDPRRGAAARELLDDLGGGSLPQGADAREHVTTGE